MIYTDYLATPVGTLEIKSSDVGIRAISFVESQSEIIQASELTTLCKQQLSEYFSGERKVFELPLDQQGTDFQKTIWKSLVTVSFGESASYKDIANNVGNPKAVRAVGAANGKNPISIVVPCHRVIGVTGKLTGYAGGLDRKKWLLAHEGISFN